MRRLHGVAARCAAPARAGLLPACRAAAPLWAAQKRVGAGLLARGGQTFSTSSVGNKAADPSTYARVALVLEDGSVFHGRSFGAAATGQPLQMSGEVVFQTGMVGYAEALTDPSYRGQLLAMTYPMVGSYGVPAFAVDAAGLPRTSFESHNIHATALICQDYSAAYSHWDASQSLGEWLASHNVPGICGVDTRRLTKLIREQGSMLGWIEPVVDGVPVGSTFDRTKVAAALAARHVVDEVTIATKTAHYAAAAGVPAADVVKVLAVDCGMKANMVRELTARGADVTVVRWDDKFASSGFMDQFDGVFVSNGPGDPTACASTIDELKHVLGREGDAIRPLFGICLGNQLTGLASGAQTTKLRFGNRGQNQPVTDNVYGGGTIVTSQNHGYAVDDSKGLPKGWKALYTNENDGSNEGLVHESKPFFTAQFHPEANGGPTDASFLFDVFLDACKQQKLGGSVKLNMPPSRVAVMNLPGGPIKAVPKKVLLLGSGGLSIGQAGEFDYSGAQAIKALKEAGVEVVLMNPNIASVQTNVDATMTREMRRLDPRAADQVYFLPVTPDFVEQVIKREQPDAILISMGGQTALNCGIELDKRGIFTKYGVRVLGTQIDAVIATEDREIFKDKMTEIGEPSAVSVAVVDLAGALAAARDVTGYPCMVRAAFALGGLGSGIVHDEAELRSLAIKALAVSPQLLVEKSMLGWKEVEYEVVRDGDDNCVTVCNMENFDPLGVHTGDSIVIAPSQTLSNAEYHMLREAALKVVRHLGIVGECNIQYALHASSMEYAIIEVNPRLSRSSALASKATGYPLAFVAAKIALGVSLPQLRNEVTGGATTACFEPALDYVVTKFPRWDLGKFQNVTRNLGSAMSSVGEVMAIGRTFEESFQKAMRMVDPGNPGFEPTAPLDTPYDELAHKVANPTDRRIWSIAEALYRGARGDKEWGVGSVANLSKIDRWWLSRLENVAEFSEQVPANVGDKEWLLRGKQLGFSDAQLAKRAGTTAGALRTARVAAGVVPRVKQIDTLAAEFAATTNYLYMTYHGDDDDVVTGADGLATTGGALVLGSGAYRIGSSVEFDWCAVSAMRSLRAAGVRGVMINCNPETVSTDYDECDALYFEELSEERVMDVYDREKINVGVVISMGGQIPQTLAVPLAAAGAHVLGTPPAMIDAAEDRSKFSALMDRAGVVQPRWAELTSMADAFKFADDVGYPVLVRPSYVLSGAAMAVARDAVQLQQMLLNAKDVSADHPVVISKFVRGARELEIDGVAQNGKIICCATHEHVEDAGVHSGDATLVLPPHTLNAFQLRTARDAAAAIADALQISGPFNVQFLVGGREAAADPNAMGDDELDGSFESMNDVRVIECNLRASRSVPFVSKAHGVDFAEVATLVLAGLPIPGALRKRLPQLHPPSELRGFTAVKASMFSFARLRGADPTLGVEMSSTGEVACFGASKEEAFLKALLSTNMQLPTGDGDRVLLSFSKPLRHKALAAAFDLHDQGYKLCATSATAEYLRKRKIPCETVGFPTDDPGGLDPNALDLLRSRSIKLVVNLHSPESLRLEDNYLIRRTAADFNIPLVTNAQLFEMLASALKKLKQGEIVGLQPESLFSYYESEQEADAWTHPQEFH
ncbi:hypothetical protein M885DRAFT_625393 [Pelagophyceae sp. CCMP2097]|nr:hypothetical protein M885DRAFT_625393 [Pelagophyceae sp. CCMP2097]